MSEGSGADDTEDGLKPVDAGFEASGVDDGADIGLALGGPHGAIAVGDLALDDGRPQGALAGIVGNLDLTGPEREGQMPTFR